MRLSGLKHEFYDKLSEDEKFRIRVYATLVLVLLVVLAQLLVIL